MPKDSTVSGSTPVYGGTPNVVSIVKNLGNK